MADIALLFAGFGSNALTGQSLTVGRARPREVHVDVGTGHEMLQ